MEDKIEKSVKVTANVILILGILASVVLIIMAFAEEYVEFALWGIGVAFTSIITALLMKLLVNISLKLTALIGLFRTFSTKYQEKNKE